MQLFSDNKIVLTLVGACIILLVTTFIVSLYLRKMKSDKSDGVLADDSWDGIKKFNNDVPVGWILSFILAIIWGLWYLFFAYPLHSFSQVGEYNEELKEYNNKFEHKWTNLDENQLVAMGDTIFQVQCSQCHGIDKSGIDGKAADLTKWGRAEYITKVILNGSEGLGYAAGMMPPLPLSEKEAKDVANFVMAEISERKIPADIDSIARGKELFALNCTACHGVNGTGLEGMDGFAPDLGKYGTYVFLEDVLKRGKKGAIGKMPSFEYANFSEVQIKALNAFIISDN